jgi:ribose transport system substrate-binding protein
LNQFQLTKGNDMSRLITKSIVALLFACAAVTIASGCSKESTPSTPGKLTIAVIPKGTTHEYWKSVKAGADQAGKDLDVEIQWKGPMKEDDRAQQISVVEQFVTDGVSGIVLAPLDDQALLRPVREAAKKNIPVVIIDSGLKGDVGKDFVSFVATDNYRGGVIAGDELSKLLDNKGKIVLLRYMEGSASTAERERGFLDAVHKHPDMQLLVENRYSGATVDSAKIETSNMLDVLRQADGIFCPNESSTLGMLLTLRQNNIAGHVKFVGFDATAPLVDALKKKEIDALVAQDPYKMGYEGVKAAVDHIHGKEVKPLIDTGVHLITPDNLSSQEIKDLLQPR